VGGASCGPLLLLGAVALVWLTLVFVASCLGVAGLYLARRKRAPAARQPV